MVDYCEMRSFNGIEGEGISLESGVWCDYALWSPI